MYVTIDGVHGVGKSTICRRLSLEYKWGWIKEIADSTIPPIGIGPNAKCPIEGEYWFINQFDTREERGEFKRPGIHIADRGPSCIQIYASSFKEEGLIGDYSYDLLIRFLNRHAKNWTLPDLEILFYAEDDEVLKRLVERYNPGKENFGETDLKHISTVNRKFHEFYELHKMAERELELVSLVDSTRESENQTLKTVADMIKKFASLQ